LKRLLSSALVLSLSMGVFAAATSAAEAKVLRIATLAPRSSTWMKFFYRMAREVAKKTKGAVKLKFYPDGSMGDEALLVEKMRLGQLHGAAITAVGLGKIQPSMLVQQVPMLFRTYKEVDCLREKMNPKFSALMEEKGYIALGYGDVGFIYMFGNKELKTPSDFRQGAKVWAWTDDPIGRAIQEAAGIPSVPLGVPDVLSSLQTGAIDTFYTAPYAAIALQWFLHAKYIMNVKIAMAVGATVLTKAAWESLPEEHRKTLRAVTEKWSAKLNKSLRRDNRNAVKTLTKKHGMKVVKLSKSDRQQWMALAKQVSGKFAGSLYSQELLDEVRATVAACRK